MRPLTPGEVSTQKLVKAEWEFKNRCYTAQIKTVDTSRGTCRVDIIGLQEECDAQIPLNGLSANTFRSSWQRYMPQSGEFVKVAFGPLNQVDLLGYSAYGEEPDPTSEDGRSGSPNEFIGGYATMQKDGIKRLNGMGDFVELAEGEWDMRSKGGAYIRGFAQGQLVMRSGGSVTLRLDKGRDEIVTRTSTHNLGGDGVELLFGEVKVLQPPQLGTQSLSDSLANAGPPPGTKVSKEYRLTIGKTTANPLLPLKLAEFRAGRLVGALGIDVLQDSTSLPLRYQGVMYDDTGLTAIPTSENLRVEVDNLGNILVKQGDTAVLGGLEIRGGVLSPLDVSFNEINVSSQLATVIEAQTTLDLSGLTGVNVNAGGAADQAMLRGDALSTYLTTKLSVTTALGPSGPALLPLVPGAELSVLAKVK